MSLDLKMWKRSKLIGLEGISFILKPIHTSFVSLLIIKLYDVRLWGSFVVFLVGIELITTLLNWGQKPFLLREFSLQPNSIGEQWSRASYSRIPLLIFAVLVLAVIPSFREYFIPLLFWTIFRWFSFLFEPIIQYYRKYGWAIIAEIAAILSTLFSILFFFEKVELASLIYVFVLSSGIKCLVLIPLLSNWEFSSFSTKVLKSELLLSFPFFALSIAGLLQTKSDLYVATYLLPKDGIAKYQVLLSFLLLGQTLSAMILGPFQKNIYRWRGNDTKKLKNLYLKIGFVLTVVFSIVLHFGLVYIYKIELPVGFILLYFVYLFLLYTYFIESQILLKHKNEKYLLYYNIIAAGCNIVLSFLLINLFGIIGALMSGIVCRVVLSALVVSKVKKIINQK